MKYSKLNFVSSIQRWMDSEQGQTFLNYAYSWGAAVVILGTLFKLTHLPAANILLFIGMGTEVFVFFISAFDRPFEKVPDNTQQSVAVNINTPKRPSSQNIDDNINNNINELLHNNKTTEKLEKQYQELLKKTEESSLLQDKINLQLRSTSSHLSKISRIYSSMVNSIKEAI